MSSFLISSFSKAPSDGINPTIVKAKQPLLLSFEKTQVVIANLKVRFEVGALGSLALRKKRVASVIESELVIEQRSVDVWFWPTTTILSDDNIKYQQDAGL